MSKVQNKLYGLLFLDQLIEVIKQRVQVVPGNQMLNEKLALYFLAFVLQFKYAFRIHNTQSPANTFNVVVINLLKIRTGCLSNHNPRSRSERGWEVNFRLQEKTLQINITYSIQSNRLL